MTFVVWGVLGAVLIGLAALFHVGYARAYAGRERLVDQRPTWTAEEIGLNYREYADLPAPQLVELVAGLAEAFDMPPGSLRPTDGFWAELAPAKGWEWGDPSADVPSILRRYYRSAELAWPPAQEVATVAEFVKLAAAAIKVAEARKQRGCAAI